MKKSLKLLAMASAVMLVGMAQAESPIGGGKPNFAMDSTPCYSWGNAGAYWTRCPAPAPVTVEKVVEKVVPGPTVTVEKIVEKPVEKIVYVERERKGE